MKIKTRLIELSDRCELTPQGYRTDMSKDELLEYRTMQTMRNVLQSRTGSSFIDADVVRFIAKQLGWDVRGFTKGKF